MPAEHEHKRPPAEHLLVVRHLEVADVSRQLLRKRFVAAERRSRKPRPWLEQQREVDFVIVFVVEITVPRVRQRVVVSAMITQAICQRDPGESRCGVDGTVRVCTGTHQH